MLINYLVFNGFQPYSTFDLCVFLVIFQCIFGDSLHYGKIWSLLQVSETKHNEIVHNDLYNFVLMKGHPVRP